MIVYKDVEYEDIDRETESWIKVFDTINDNFDKVVYSIVNKGRRYYREEFTVRRLDSLTFDLHDGYLPNRNNLTVFVDGVQQYAFRDYEEIDATSIRLLEPNAVEYMSKVVVYYYVQKDDPSGYRVPEELIQEYEDASDGFHDPRDRVRDRLEEVINKIFIRHKHAKDKADIYLHGVEESETSVRFLEDYHDDSIPPGDYYLFPVAGSDGTIRWEKSQPSIKKPKARTFVHRTNIEENAIFVGGDGVLPDQVLGTGVVVHEDGKLPGYADHLPVSAGGTGVDTGISGTNAGILVVNESPEEPKQGIVTSSGILDVIPTEMGGTGTTEKASLVDAIGFSSDKSLNFDVISSVSFNKVMSSLSSFRKYVGMRVTVPTTSSVLGDLGFIIIGIGSEKMVGEDRPKFTLIADSPIVTSPLSDDREFDGPYRTYNRLETLHSTLNEIRRSFTDEVKGQLKPPSDKLFDFMTDRNHTIDTGIMNPSDRALRKNHKASITNQYLWLMSLSEADTGNVDRILPIRFYEYFSMLAEERVMGIVGDSDGFWTRSQAVSTDVPRYYAYTKSGDVEAVPVNEPMGIVPLICV